MEKFVQFMQQIIPVSKGNNTICNSY